MNHFLQKLAAIPCWDQHCQDLFVKQGFVAEDRLLQNRAEVSALCEWMESKKIDSYLEIGLWTGQLLTFISQQFSLRIMAACDLLHASRLGLPVHIPPQVQFFSGSSQELQYQLWRKALGPIDMILIDGDHSYNGVKRDFEINRRLPHRYLVLHDIANPLVPGPGQLWRELTGQKQEIILPNPDLKDPQQTMGLGIWSAA